MKLPTKRSPIVLVETPQDYADIIQLIADKSKELCLSTYGIYAGIGISKYTGYPYNIRDDGINEALDYLSCRSLKVKIIVGKLYFKECKPNCKDCKKAKEDWIKRTEMHRDYWKEFEWVFTDKHHAKFVASDSGYVVIGSRNLASSDAFEASICIRDEALSRNLRERVAGIKSCDTLEPQSWEVMVS